MAETKLNFTHAQWRNFCNLTGIKGFYFLFNARTRVERLLWIVTLLMGVCMTIYDVTQTCITFQSGATMTQLFVKADRPFPIPNITLCLIAQTFQHWKSHGTDIYDPKSVENFLNSFAGVQNTSEYYERQMQQLWDEIYNGTIGEPFSFEKVVDPDFPKLLYLTSAMLLKLADYHITPADHLNVSLMSSLQLLRKFHLQRNLTIAKLLKLVPPALCSIMGLRVRHNHDYIGMKPVDQCNSDRISWFGPQRLDKPPVRNSILVCVQLSSELLNFKSRGSYLSIEFNQSALIMSESTSNDVFSIQFGSDPVSYSESESLVYPRYNYAHTWSISLIGDYQSLSTEKFPCSSDITFYECSIDCMTKTFYEMHKCYPIFAVYSHSYKSGIRHLCNKLNGTTKFEDPQDVQITENCRKPCKLRCKKRIFNYLNFVAPLPGATRFDIFLQSFTYPQFEEIDSMTWRTFMGQLGGNLSLWIGASFLVILHILTFVVQLPLSYIETLGIKPTPKPVTSRF